MSDEAKVNLHYSVVVLMRKPWSGTSASRPESKWLLTQLRTGDTVHNYKLDRLGRSLRHLLKQLGVHEIAQRLHTLNVTLYKYLRHRKVVIHAHRKPVPSNSAV